MAIKCNEESHSFFNNINSTIATQISRILKYRTQDFKLVRENKYGSTLFAKIYLKKSGKPSCLISKGKSKEVIELDDLVDENFSGSCIIKVLHAFIGGTKSISISVEEILVRSMQRESYFTNESEDESENED